MKLFIKTLFVSLFAVLLSSCYGDLGDDITWEEDLVVALNPNPGSPTTPVITLGASYDFNVLVQSQMPPQGVTVNVAYRQDSDNTLVFGQEYSTTTSPLPVTITNIPFDEVGTVTITVTSKTKADNTVTKTFKLVRK